MKKYFNFKFEGGLGDIPHGKLFENRDSKSWPLSYAWGTIKQTILQFCTLKIDFFDTDGASVLHHDYNDKSMLVWESIGKYFINTLKGGLGDIPPEENFWKFGFWKWTFC